MPASPADSSSLTARTSWLIAGKTIAFAFSIAIPIVLVRRLPQHEFGLYKQIFLVVHSAANMLPLGFGMTAFYFLPRETRHRNHTVLNVVVFCAAVGILFAALLALFPSVLIRLFREPDAAGFAWWIGLVVVLWIVAAFLEIVTVANQEIKIATASILAIQLTRAAFLFSAAVVGGTVRAVLVAAVAQGVVQIGALVWYLHTRFPGFWREFDFAFFKRQFGYALPFGLAGTLYLLQNDLHNYVVSHEFGPAVYAIYAIGCFQIPLFGILTESVGSVMIPRVTVLQHENRPRDIVLLTARVIRKLAAIYFPAYAFLLVMRRDFIIGLFTSRYIESLPVFAVNLTLIPMGIFLLDPIMRAYAEHRHFLVKLQVCLVAGLAIGLPAAIARFGLVGAISLLVLCHAIARVLTLAKVARMLDVRVHELVPIAELAKLGTAAAAGALVAMAARALMPGLVPLAALAACGVFFTVAYAAVALALGAITPQERSLAAAALARFTASSRMRLAQAALPARD